MVYICISEYNMLVLSVNNITFFYIHAILKIIHLQMT